MPCKSHHLRELIRSGSAPAIAKRPASTKAEKNNLLQNEVEDVVVEAKRPGVEMPPATEQLTKRFGRITAVDDA